jgi:hypothetical protein
MFTPASPDTFSYLILGLAAVSVILLGFIGSMVIRHRNLQRDLEAIEELSRDQ